jgi:hypothetical protein
MTSILTSARLPSLPSRRPSPCTPATAAPEQSSSTSCSARSWARGFALLTSFDGPGLAGLPLLADWSAELDHGGQLLQLLEPGGSLYDGNLGAAVPDGWHKTVRGRGQLVVLVGSAIDLGLEDRTERIEAARRAGAVVGAQVPVHAVDLNTPP